MVKDIMFCKYPDNTFGSNIDEMLFGILKDEYKKDGKPHLELIMFGGNSELAFFNIKNKNGNIRFGHITVDRTTRKIVNIIIDEKYCKSKPDSIYRYRGYVVAASTEWF